jgi:hypothetical protein
MKRITVIILITLATAGTCALAVRANLAHEDRSNMTVLVFPFRLRADITDYRRYIPEYWPAYKIKYETVISGATETLRRGMAGAGFRGVAEGSLPVLPKSQQGPPGGGTLWPFVHAAIMAGADVFLLCDITRMEFTEPTSHYLFEMYSVSSYRLAVNLDVMLVDARTERALRTVRITDSVTHRVHRLFWDSIFIHHYVSGPDLAVKLMESAVGKIVRAIE